MIKKWSMSYPAVNGTEQRRAYVYLPTMYEAQPERRFPVLYMFDGQNVFFDEDATYGKSWESRCTLLSGDLLEHQVRLWSSCSNTSSTGRILRTGTNGPDQHVGN